MRGEWIAGGVTGGTIGFPRKRAWDRLKPKTRALLFWCRKPRTKWNWLSLEKGSLPTDHVFIYQDFNLNLAVHGPPNLGLARKDC